MSSLWQKVNILSRINENIQKKPPELYLFIYHNALTLNNIL